VYEAARAHNRAITRFCADDDRLLAVGWVPLDDPSRGLSVAREALDLGCTAIEIPSEARGPRAISHVDHEPLWTLLESVGSPLIFHLGSGGDSPGPVFANTGRPVVDDPDGNADPLRKLRVIALAGPVEMALAALIFDGVLDRHPDLMVGVIEHGASWVPGFLRRLDLAVELDSRTWRGPDTPRELPMPASDYVLRQVRFTPFPDEPLGWIIDQTDPRLHMFSTDFPHGEGGEDPLGAFMSQLTHRRADVVEGFLHGNFESLVSRRRA
jgi:predicted TIM-barrel fold metal-dependent hydrolase